MLTKTIGLGSILAGSYYVREKYWHTWQFDNSDIYSAYKNTFVKKSLYNNDKLIPYATPRQMGTYLHVCRNFNYDLAKKCPEILFKNITMLPDEDHKQIFNESLAKSLIYEDPDYIIKLSKHEAGCKIIADYYKETQTMRYYGRIFSETIRYSIIRHLYPKNDITDEVLKCIDKRLRGYDLSSSLGISDYETVYLFLIQYDNLKLHNLPEKYRTYKVCMTAMENEDNLYYVPEPLRTYELCLIAVEKNNYNIEYVPKLLLTSEMCNKITNPECLKYIPKEHQTRNLIKTMIRNHPTVSFIRDLKTSDEYIYKLACCYGQDPTKITDETIKSLTVKWYKDNSMHLRKFGSMEEVERFLEVDAGILRNRNKFIAKVIDNPNYPYTKSHLPLEGGSNKSYRVLESGPVSPAPVSPAPVSSPPSSSCWFA